MREEKFMRKDRSRNLKANVACKTWRTFEELDREIID